MDYCAAAFVSTHAALSAQRLLEGVCPFQVMPVLREISRGCGISIRFDPSYLSTVQTALSALPPEQYGFYGISGSGSSLSAVPLSQNG